MMPAIRLADVAGLPLREPALAVASLSWQDHTVQALASTFVARGFGSGAGSQSQAVV